MIPEAYPYLLGAMGLIVGVCTFFYNAEDDERIKVYLIAECTVALKMSLGAWLLVELATRIPR